MEPTVRTLPVDRLTELVSHLSGVRYDVARHAVAVAVDHHGDEGDGLWQVAAALVALRRGAEVDLREPVPSQEVSRVPV